MLPGNITSTFAKGGGAALGDPKTSLLLHMDGAAQAFVDSSNYHKAMTAVGGYKQGTPAKFGSGAGMWNGAGGDYLYVAAVAADPDLTLGTGDFTIDFWLYSTNVTATSFVLDFRPTNTNAGPHACLYYSSGKFVYNIGGSNAIAGAITIAVSTWYHIALIRSAGVTRFYVNGVAEAATFTDATNYACPANRPVISGGGYSVGNPHQGQIDEFRISKGIARWTTNFTPPTVPY